jgi:hypothetical protein
MAAERKTTIKRNIKPTTFNLTIVATKVNENGTFSGLTVTAVKGPNSTAKVSIPPMSGGAMYLKVDTLENVTVLADTDNSGTPTPKVKLF